MVQFEDKINVLDEMIYNKSATDWLGKKNHSYTVILIVFAYISIMTWAKNNMRLWEGYFLKIS